METLFVSSQRSRLFSNRKAFSSQKDKFIFKHKQSEHASELVKTLIHDTAQNVAYVWKSNRSNLILDPTKHSWCSLSNYFQKNIFVFYLKNKSTKTKIARNRRLRNSVEWNATSSLWIPFRLFINKNFSRRIHANIKHISTQSNRKI